MNAIREKRSNPRHQCRLKAKCAQFVRSVYYGADVLNVSKGGMFLETKMPVKAGVAMLVKEIRPDAHADGDSQQKPSRCALTIAVGEVTRCHQIINPDGRLTYHIGLKFLLPSV